MKAIFNVRRHLSNSRIRRIAAEGIWVTFGQVVAIVGTVLLVRVLTEYLTPKQYGQVALVLTIAGLANQLVMGGLIAGIPRFYIIAFQKRQLRSFSRASVKLLQHASLLLVALGLIIVALLIILKRNEFIADVAAIIIFSIFSGIGGTCRELLNSARKRATMAIHFATDAWLKIGIAILLFTYVGVNTTTAILSYTISSMIIAISQFYFVSKLISNDEHHGYRTSYVKYWKQKIWRFAWPFSSWGIFTWGQQSSDRWSLEKFSSTVHVGEYVVAYQLGYLPIQNISGLATTYFAPIFYQRSANSNVDSVHKLAWSITLVCLATAALAFGITWYLHEFIFEILVAAPFRSASKYLPWTILAGGFFAGGQMLVLKLMSELKSTVMVGSRIVTAIVGIVLNVCLAMKYGTAGVITSLLIFSVLYFLWMSYLTMNRSKEFSNK